jgi:steroid 5-alpha reductase family enzyme
MMKRDEVVFAVALAAGCAVLLASDLPFETGLAVSCACFLLLWLASLALRDASIVDVFWGPGFVVLGWSYHAAAEPRTRIGLVVCVLVTVWGLRLAAHIGLRNAGSGEDFRYRQWREKSGRSFWWVSLFKVFLLQAVVLWLVSSPLLVAQAGAPEGWENLVMIVGLLLWAIGFGFESVADWQLMRFKSEPANQGKVLASGLWGLSRHPNYFGEAVLWWGIGLIAASVGGALALMGPAFMTFTLVRVSGVAMLDRELVDRRPGYRDYIRNTPAFIPIRFRRAR